MQRRSGTGPRVAPVEIVTAPKLLLATAAISTSGRICLWGLEHEVGLENAAMAALPSL